VHMQPYPVPRIQLSTFKRETGSSLWSGCPRSSTREPVGKPFLYNPKEGW
jgi:hypothetical protein